jgi:hypothetical protein
VSLAREQPVADPTGQRKFRYEMFRYLDPQLEESGCIDEIGIIYHGFNVTHLDALCHLFTPEGSRGIQRLLHRWRHRQGRREARRGGDGQDGDRWTRLRWRSSDDGGMKPTRRAVWLSKSQLSGKTQSGLPDCGSRFSQT